ncbi:MAG: dynamin family protein [Synergistaceae bacterium]|nr:dynamin family protein [Synergistaceae bacterium]
MQNISEWERENFINSPYLPELTVIFPSREIYFSNELLQIMRLNNNTCPKTLDQWFELCHPKNHAQISRFEKFINGHENFLSLVRNLYCGDGFYRAFRLDAFIQRNSDNSPIKLFGRETLALSAWLENSNEGDKIECTDNNGRVKILEAVRVQGVMTLNDISAIEDLQQENMRLRREIQRRIFSASPAILQLSSSDAQENFIRSELEKNINSALNVLTGNNQLTALRRSLNESALTIGITGLTSSGKSSFINALLGEKLIPEQTRATTNIPIICREGESRSAKIFYQDGRVELIPSRKLTASFMRNIASENFNPSNRAGIARIEIIIPGALIPEGLCFVDTPGFDALASSGGAALRNILPELDYIIYVTPIRARLKAADYEFLRIIMTLNEKIIFVLSQIDLERQDSEAGRVIKSAHDKIISDVKALQTGMKKFAGLDVDVVPVSAKTALEKFYDKKSPEWIDSNVEEVINYLAPLRKNAFARALILRTERTARVINSALEQNNLTGSSKWRLQDVSENLQKILSAKQNLPSITQNYSVSEGAFNDSKPSSLINSLITSMMEREFKSRFFALDSLKYSRKIVLLGADRSQSLKLLARLAHNLLYENLPEGESSACEWLYSGHNAPFESILLPAIGIDENILIAPSNLNIKNFSDWHKLFREYVPVISIDLARLDSGLSDLAYSPYITGLALSKWVLAFGNAGLFDTRPTDLFSEVPARVNEFIELNGLKTPDWFIFENYKIFN